MSWWMWFRRNRVILTAKLFGYWFHIWFGRWYVPKARLLKSTPEHAHQRFGLWRILNWRIGK